MLCTPQKRTPYPHLARDGDFSKQLYIEASRIKHKDGTLPLKSSDLKAPPEFILSSLMLRTYWKIQNCQIKSCIFDIFTGLLTAGLKLTNDHLKGLQKDTKVPDQMHLKHH